MRYVNGIAVNDTHVNDSFDVETVIESVRLIAQAKINAIAPEWKQRNLLATALDLDRESLSLWQSTKEFLTGAKKQRVEEIQAVWVRIKAIRDYSDYLVNEVMEGNTSIDINEGWSE